MKKQNINRTMKPAGFLILLVMLFTVAGVTHATVSREGAKKDTVLLNGVKAENDKVKSCCELDSGRLSHKAFSHSLLHNRIPIGSIPVTLKSDEKKNVQLKPRTNEN